MKTRNLIRCALASALIALCAWITIPSAIPFTMQTFGVFLTLGLLGGKRGTAAVLTYLLLGAVGMPVFSGFRGGVGMLFGSTGGYLTGFLVAGGIYWLLTELPIPEGVAMGAGMLGCYAFGSAWFLLFYAGDQGLWAVLAPCVFPFLLPDVLKITLALTLSRRIRPHIGKVDR